MIRRIGRLVRVELMKLFAHPFFAVSLALVLATTLLAGWVTAATSATAWHHPHAVDIFASGSKWGLRLVSFVVLISGAMLFAGEFDRGTIKLLLTRPITRGEVFAAKAVSNAILALVLMGAVFGLAWGIGCWKGELGPVWDPEEYVSPVSSAALLGHLVQAIQTAVPSIIALGLLGLLLSNVVESSGHAVGLALVLAMGVGLATEVASRWEHYWVNTYPGYALSLLGEFARGKAARWRDLGSLPWSVPLATALISLALGFIIFRRRNITA
jgi:ABC-2 type transport system permease protein